MKRKPLIKRKKKKKKRRRKKKRLKSKKKKIKMKSKDKSLKKRKRKRTIQMLKMIPILNPMKSKMIKMKETLHKMIKIKMIHHFHQKRRNREMLIFLN